MKTTRLITITLIALLGLGTLNAYAQKKPKLIKAVLADGKFNISTAHLNKALREQRNLNLQDHLRLYRVVASQLNRAERLNILASAQKFVIQNGRWMRTDYTTLEEALLAKEANILIKDGPQFDPTVVQLKELRNTAQRTEEEQQILDDLEKFIAAHNRLPRTRIVPASGKINQVADMSAEQIAEFKLAHQIEYILEKDPSSAVAQKIQALKEKWNK